MLITSNVHTHSKFCDGRYTIEDMVKAAIEKGFDTLGISPHSYVEFDIGGCLQKPQEFLAEMARLKTKYADKIDLLTGVELDYFGKLDYKPDYIIGSVHFVEVNGEHYCFENTPELAKSGLDKYFNGDKLALTKKYYQTVVDMVQKFKPDIVGHYDIISKFCERIDIADVDDTDYQKIALKAVDDLISIKSDLVFELNTHGVYRNYRTVPYPARFILEHINKAGGRVMLSSDSHDINSLGFMFDELIKYLKSIGFTAVYQLKRAGFERVEI